MKPCVLIAREKFGDRYLSVLDEAQLGAVALALVRERPATGAYYFDAAKDRAEKWLAEGDGVKAWRFLRSRNDYEYEGVELVELEVIP